MPDPSTPAKRTHCADCGTPLSPSSAARGRQRCLACANRRKRFTTASARQAVRAKAARRAELERLAQLAKEAGLG